MVTERDPRPPSFRRRAGTPPVERQRIPLPPLPALRRPAPPGSTGGVEPKPSSARGLSHEEADLLHGGRPEPFEAAPGAGRTGALGARILNDLVEEIEKDLEDEMVRHPAETALPPYRRTVGCSCTLHAAAAAPGADPNNLNPEVRR